MCVIPIQFSYRDLVPSGGDDDDYLRPCGPRPGTRLLVAVEEDGEAAGCIGYQLVWESIKIIHFFWEEVSTRSSSRSRAAPPLT